MAATFSIAVDLGNIPVGAALNAGTLPHLSHAVKSLVEGAHQRWLGYAMGMPLPDGKVINNRSGTYSRSILIKQTGEFSGEVFSELPYAESIENGTPARDLKKILDSSMKVRLTRDGRRYLIIPFRHQTPGAVGTTNVMPPEVHEWWQGKEKSFVTSTFRRNSGTGAYDIKTRSLITVEARKYHWGHRLGKADIAAMGIHGKEAKRMVGMVNFRNPGTGNHSSYITFRCMVEGSKGWNAKAVEGKHPAKTVADAMRPIAEEMFKAALQADIEALLGR